MNAKNPQPEPEDSSQVIVTKSTIDSLIYAHNTPSITGEFLWPIAPRALLELYKSSPEHCRAINLKAFSCFGNGLAGEQVSKIDDLCEFGAINLFVSLEIDQGTYGNAFMQIIQTPKGEIVELRRLPAITMSRFRDGFMQRTYNAEGREKIVYFTKDEIVHFRDPCPKGAHYSLPSWTGTTGMLELAHAAIKYNQKFFANNAIPEYAVVFKGKNIEKTQRDAIRSFFSNDIRGIDNAHRTLLLTVDGDETEKIDDLIKIEKITADVKDADFLKLLDAAKDRIPIAHGTPPRMLGIVAGGSLGGAGEVAGQLFSFEHTTCRPKRQFTLDQCRPFLKRIGLRPGKLDDGLKENEIDFRPLDLTPPKDDAEDLPDLVQAGIITPEEAKRIHPNLRDRLKALQKSSGAGENLDVGAARRELLAALLMQS